MQSFPHLCTYCLLSKMVACAIISPPLNILSAGRDGSTCNHFPTPVQTICWARWQHVQSFPYPCKSCHMNKRNVTSCFSSCALTGRSVMVRRLCCVVARVEGPFDALYLMTQFDGRSKLEFQMLLYSWQSQQKQRLAINFLHK